MKLLRRIALEQVLWMQVVCTGGRLARDWAASARAALNPYDTVTVYSTSHALDLHHS